MWIVCEYECRIYSERGNDKLVTINDFQIHEKGPSYAGVYFKNLKVVKHVLQVTRTFCDIENLQLQSDSDVKMTIQKGHIQIITEDDALVSWENPTNNLCFDAPAISGF